MNPPLPLLLCFFISAALCQCSSDGEKTAKKDYASMSLAQRSMQKPDMNRRSHFEKSITNSSSKNGAGSYFQHQAATAGSFAGVGSFAGQKAFKAKESRFGKTTARGLDLTYALGDMKASESGSQFDTEASKLGTMQAREGRAKFSGADDEFKTRHALPGSKRKGKEPTIIETIEATPTKKGAYSEEEVRKLLNRN